VLEEQHLNPSLHNRADFDCGIPELNNYLARYATQDSRRNLSQVYVLVDTDKPDEVLGYYTLSAAHIDINQISEQERRRLPHYPIPCFRMGRFAIRQKNQGQYIGKRLLGCAVDRCLRARREVAAYALIVDAKDAEAKSFYEHFGFNALADNPFSLYLPIP
jgi:predicted GNAT family N-acyltransferase